MASIQKRILQDGSIRYLAQIRKKGFKTVNITKKTKEAARKEARKIELAMDDGTWDELKYEAQKHGNTSLRYFINLYLIEIAPNKNGGEKSFEYEQSILNMVLKSDLANMDIYKISPAHINNLVKKWKADGNKDSTIKRKLTVISGLFTQIPKNWIHNDSLKNPVKNITADLESGERREREITPAELFQIRESLSKCQSPYIGWMFELALETGARRRELIENKWSNIKLDKGYMIIPAQIAKTRKERHVPLTPKAKSIFKDMEKVKKNDELFPISTKSFIEAWKRTKKRSGIDDIQFRDTRHYALTMLSDIYPKAQDLARISGHTKLETLLGYYRGKIETQVQVMDDFFK